jgi:hypothetical protein
MPELPNRSNFFCDFETRVKPAKIAKAFRPPTWSVRKSSWYDYEATCEFAELEIVAADPALISGSVADVIVNGPSIIELLTGVGFFGSFEFYNDAHEVISKGEFGNPNYVPSGFANAIKRKLAWLLQWAGSSFHKR